MNRVSVEPELIQWALDRSGKHPDILAKKLPKIEEWLTGESSPTLKQLETFAKATYTPIGFLFLPEPPDEQMPIPDFRTMATEYFDRPSPDLLDTIYICQQRQEWYSDFERSMGEDPLPFVGSTQPTDSVIQTAALMRKALGFDIEERKQMRTWSDALRRFIEQADLLGVLVMVSGVVGSDNRRKLDPREFRGFTLSDELAPLVFINGADTKSAQMFTLAHELAHVWLGEAAVSDAEAVRAPGNGNRVERWCNQVAAELLVPLDAIGSAYDSDNDLQDEMNRLARRFKVSTLMVLRRIHDLGGLTRDELSGAYDHELQRILSVPKGSGGNFYLTQAARVSKRFARALVVSTLEGRTLYRDAFRMLGFSKHTTFRKLGHSLGWCGGLPA